MDFVLCTSWVKTLSQQRHFQIKMLGTDRLKTSTAVVLSCEKGAVLSHFNASSATHSVVSMMDAMRKIMIGRLSFPNRESIVWLAAFCFLSKFAGERLLDIKPPTSRYICQNRYSCCRFVAKNVRDKVCEFALLATLTNYHLIHVE